MSKKLLVALILIAVAVIIFVLNRGTVDLNLIVTHVIWMKSLVLLAFTALGVAIGVLLK